MLARKVNRLFYVTMNKIKLIFVTLVNSDQKHEGMRLNIQIVKIEKMVRRFPKCHFLLSG